MKSLKVLAAIAAVVLVVAGVSACQASQSSQGSQTSQSSQSASESVSPSSPASSAADLSGLDSFLESFRTLEVGTAGSSMQAAQCAVMLLDWAQDSAFSDDAVRAEVEKWYSTLTSEERGRLGLLLSALSGGADSVLDPQTGKDMLESIGDPQKHDSYDRAKFDAVVAVISSVSAEKGFDMLLDEVASVEVGTAGCSMKAAAVAVHILDWSQDNTLASDKMQAAVDKWYASLSTDEIPMLADQLEELTGGADSVLDAQTGADMLESIGDPQQHDSYDRAAFDAIIAMISAKDTANVG